MITIDGINISQTTTGVNQSLSQVLGVGNDASNLRITNLGNPINPQDAANKNYIDGKDLGDILSINNSADGYRIINLGTPLLSTDAVNKGYVDNFMSTGSAAGGDLTGTYPNPTIGSNKITFAKMQTVATDSLLGRDSSGTGNVENITLNSTLEMNGSLVLQRAALTGDVTASAGSNITIIGANVVSNSKFRQSSGLSIVGRSASTTGDVADITATTSSDTVLRESGGTIGFGTIATAAINNNAITFAKMQTITTDSLLGRDTSGTGLVEIITLNSTLEFTGSGTIQRAALTGDITASAGSNSTTLTNNVVTDAKFRQSAALSIVGRSANSTGNVADISTTSSSNAVLRESGGVIGFGSLSLNSLSAQATKTLIANATGLSATPTAVGLGAGLDFISNLLGLKNGANAGDILMWSGSGWQFISAKRGTTLTDGYATVHPQDGYIRVLPNNVLTTNRGIILGTNGAASSVILQFDIYETTFQVTFFNGGLGGGTIGIKHAGTSPMRYWFRFDGTNYMPAGMVGLNAINTA